jgi:DNA (cytosine-5)-methyltransferase 1
MPALRTFGNGGSGSPGTSTLPTPRAQNGNDRNSRIWQRPEDEPQNLENALARIPAVAALLPTPAASNPNDGESPDTWLARAEQLRAKGINGNGAGMPLAIAAALLPTPTARDGLSGPGHADSAEGSPDLRTTVARDRWGRYATAIARWEQVTGYPAPDPTVPGSKGQPVLNPRLPEWMMGLPPDHLNVPGVSASAQKTAAGNGVVPAQAELAIRLMLGIVVNRIGDTPCDQ